MMKEEEFEDLVLEIEEARDSGGTTVNWYFI